MLTLLSCVVYGTEFNPSISECLNDQDLALQAPWIRNCMSPTISKETTDFDYLQVLVWFVETSKKETSFLLMFDESLIKIGTTSLSGAFHCILQIMR